MRLSIIYAGRAVSYKVFRAQDVAVSESGKAVGVEESSVHYGDCDVFAAETGLMETVYAQHADLLQGMAIVSVNGVA